MSIAVAEPEAGIEQVRFEGEGLIVESSDGPIVGTPVRWYPRLVDATAEQRNRCELLGDGIGVHWPDVDEDLSLAGMLAGRAAPGVER